MPTTNQLPTAVQISPGDYFPIWSTDNGDTRRALFSTLVQFLSEDAFTYLVVGQYIQTLPTTVAELPSAAVAGSGARAFVTDAVPITFFSGVSGGGSNRVPVYSDGDTWRVG